MPNQRFLTYCRFAAVPLLFYPLIFFLPSLRAEPRLPHLFSDHMVLQRDMDISVWGWADPIVDMLLFADWNGWSEDTYFYNNIFYAAGLARFSHGVSRAADGAYSTSLDLEPSKNNVFDSNLYYGVKPPANDAHAVAADPKLVAARRGDVGRVSLSGYRLQPDSPAKASGKLIENSGGRDFWGNVVPSCDKTDRGASQSHDCEIKNGESRR